jgi:DNA-binding Lrp family transcriptional regulator
MPVGYILLDCDLGSEDGVLDELRRIPEVTEASPIYGPYDIVVRVESDSMEKLREVVTWQVRRIDHVKSTVTLIKIMGQGESTARP